MDPKVLAFLLSLLSFVSTVLGSFTIFVAYKFHGRRFKLFLAAALSATAGVMLFISFVDILQQSIEHFRNIKGQEDHAYKWAFLFFFSGLLLGFILDVVLEKFGHDSHSEMTEEMLDTLARQHRENQLASQEVDNSNDKGSNNNNSSSNTINANSVEIDIDSGDIDKEISKSERNSSIRHSRYGDIPINNNETITDSEKKKLLRVSIVTGIALSVHNFPEGLATFTAAMDSSKMGITLGIAMIIHDCPEGMAVAIPTFFATKSKTLAIVVTAISGISQPLGALFAWLIIKDGVSDFVYGLLFGLVGGIMTMITLEELLPSAIKYDPEDKVTTKTLILGMGIVALIVAFL